MVRKVKIQIKSYLGEVLFEYSCVDNTIKKTVERAVKGYANLKYADLRYADLENANLWNANLKNANLWNADLKNADLRNADLRNADLRYAKNLANIYKTDLAILKSQPGKLRAYKYLNGNTSPYENAEYVVGKTYTCKDYSSDEFELCGKGLNVATLDWCLRDTNCNLDKIYIEVEFTAKDIVAIPCASDGKFRVKKFKILRKLTKKELTKAIKPLSEGE